MFSYSLKLSGIALTPCKLCFNQKLKSITVKYTSTFSQKHQKVGAIFLSPQKSPFQTLPQRVTQSGVESRTNTLQGTAEQQVPPFRKDTDSV